MVLYRPAVAFNSRLFMLDPLPSYKELGSLAFDYTFDCPVGVWRARLDAKAWAKTRTILLYFTELETDKRYCVSVFDATYYSARDGGINFRRSGERGQVFDLETAKTRTGRTSFRAATIIGGAENEDAAHTAAPEIMPIS
jgi:hypothetical protein